jgi:peptide-methionine (S)-S-oxide reductase
LRTHASTSNHKMRIKYRSAIYVFEADQKMKLSAILDQLQEGFEQKLVTNVMKMVEFEHSSNRFKNYYADDPEKPFCQAYIDPKLSILRAEYGAYLDT